MTWYTKGYVLFQMEDYHDAMLCFAKTLEIDPDDKYAKAYQTKAINMLYKCKCPECQGD